MAVGGMFPETPHGVALASVYVACLEFTRPSAIAAFASLARMIDPALNDVHAAEAATACPDLMQDFIGRIGLAHPLRDLGIAEEDISALAMQSMVLPDYRNNPRVPTHDQMLEIIAASF